LPVHPVNNAPNLMLTSPPRPVQPSGGDAIIARVALQAPN